MKITDPEVIKNGEKDLIESVQEDLDIDAVREILKERMSVAALTSKGGQIVVHNNEIAFRLDFEINLSGSLLFDREGNFLDASKEEGSEDPDLGGQAFAIPEEEEEDDFGQEGHAFESDPEVDEDIEEDDDLSIDLPDYDLEDELEADEGKDSDQDLDIDEELDLAAEELTLDALEEEIEDDLDLEEEENPDFTQPLDDDDDPFGDEEMDAQDLDDDINDILKESREFWEQKKDS